MNRFIDESFKDFRSLIFIFVSFQEETDTTRMKRSAVCEREISSSRIRFFFEEEIRSFREKVSLLKKDSF